MCFLINPLHCTIFVFHIWFFISFSWMRTAPASRFSAMRNHVSSSMNHAPLQPRVEVAHPVALRCTTNKAIKCCGRLYSSCIRLIYWGACVLPNNQDEEEEAVEEDSRRLHLELLYCLKNWQAFVKFEKRIYHYFPTVDNFHHWLPVFQNFKRFGKRELYLFFGWTITKNEKQEKLFVHVLLRPNQHLLIISKLEVSRNRSQHTINADQFRQS